MESIWLQHYSQGVPDAKSGEALKVYAGKQDPDLTAEALIAHCRANLTGDKVPKQVAFRDTSPKSPIGKILRRKLKEEGAAA